MPHLQVPEATVWYGPDTYMGRNLAQLFSDLALLPDEEVRQDCEPYVLLCTAGCCCPTTQQRDTQSFVRPDPFAMTHVYRTDVYCLKLLPGEAYCAIEG